MILCLRTPRSFHLSTLKSLNFHGKKTFIASITYVTLTLVIPFCYIKLKIFKLSLSAVLKIPLDKQEMELSQGPMAGYFLFVLPDPFSTQRCALGSSLYALHHLVPYSLAFN